MEETPKKTLSDLVLELARLKIDENNMKNLRIACELEIGELVNSKPQGSQTVDAGNGMKVTVTRGTDYTADVDALRNDEDLCEIAPLTYVPPQAATYTFDEAAYRKMVKNDPCTAALLSKHITSKPKKLSVAIKVG